MPSFLRQIVRVPLGHFFAALGLGAALGVGFWLWSRALPVDYVSSALLSYEAPHQFLAEHADAVMPPLHIAELVLTPATVLRVADQVKFPVGPTRAEDFRFHFDLAQPAPGLLQITYRGRDPQRVSATVNALAGALAAWVATPAPIALRPVPPVAAPLPIAQPVPVSHADITIGATSAPARQLSPSQRNELKRHAAELRRRADVLDEDVATYALQQHTIENQLQKLATEEKGLKHPQASSSEKDLGDGSRQDLEAQLRVAKKRLRELRANFSPGYPDLEAAKEHVGALELRIASLPATSHADSAPDPRQARLAAIAKSTASLRQLRADLEVHVDNGRRESRDLRQQAETAMQDADGAVAAPVEPPAPMPATATTPAPAAPHVASTAPATTALQASEEPIQQTAPQGHFTVLAWGEKPHPLADDSRQILLWLGIAASIALTGMYLTLAAWRFRAVTNLASLRDGLPGEVKYLGAISGSPLPENPS